MRIQYSRRFVRHFKARIKPHPTLHDRFDQRVALFLQNPTSPALKDHKLIGKLRSFRAFSITGDVRVVYSQESENSVIFFDIGTHNQVYS